jgi:anti-sigma B factor antagonist
MKATVKHRKIGPVDSVAIAGRLTAAEAPAIRQEILDVLARGDSRLVLDLSELAFCDSSGLSVLISALKAARGNGGNVVLAGLTPTIRALIELTRLQQVFEIFDDAEVAAARMG